MNTTTDTFRIDDPYPQLTQEILHTEYVVNHLTDKQIAKKYGVSSKTSVWRRRKFFGIQNIYPGKSNKNASKNRSVIIAETDALRWIECGKNYFEIAAELGCSRMSICRRFKELGLVRETREAKKKLRWHTELSDGQSRFLLGTLLGDGSITPAGMFQCNHSAKQKAYVEYKLGILRSLVAPNFELTHNETRLCGYSKIHHSLYLRTMQNKYLKQLARVFYPNGEKIFPSEYLQEAPFDEFSLAIWYMDDGSLHGNCMSIYTYGFGWSGNLDIQKFMFNKFDVRSEIKADNGKDRNLEKRHYIHFDAQFSERLFTLIAPHIIPSMQYKLPPFFRTATKQKGPPVLSAE